ncbi:hypothetical protein [Flaviaesturariibacter aridisoli]|uniref:DUF3078 domain-containing protein n=1 Tax=Flaviaesturariibacter aridisoli TaxID=2545761 RepID=A0A4R4DYA2_9BACT|nr:hypothetical protein [Flaviaesturariibacter aridisoli]TCZ70516.1 hypothetical protein E0486_11205 [Flaviaesturariibacter aridisoli]
MKHFFVVLLLAFAGSTTPSFAQSDVPKPYANPLIPAAPSRADAIFNTPPPGALPHQFTFGLGNGNSLRMELTYVGQLQLVNDLDSLLRSVWTGLQPFYDSLSKPLVNRRIDYRIGRGNDVQVRLLEYPQDGQVFHIRSGDTSQVKVEQDTLRILMFSADTADGVRPYVINGGYLVSTAQMPFSFTLLLNNISDLPRLSAADLHWALNHVKEELGRNLYNNRSKYWTRYSASYDAGTRRKVSNRSVRPQDDVSISPHVQVGLQYMRGTWMPSAGVGFELTFRRNQTNTQQVRFLWEPNFDFGRNTDGKVTTARNDFITLQYSRQQARPGTRVPTFSQSYSLSYLRRRRSDTFEENTFKFTLPGLQTKNLLLEPQFVFNNFFKNFSPGLKLTLMLE